MNPTSLDAMMSSLADCLDGPSLESIVNLRSPPEAEERVEYLAERANEGQLTQEERSEYEGCVRFSNFLSVLKLKARHRLGQS